MLQNLDTYNYFYNKTTKYTEIFILIFIKNCFNEERDYNYFENTTSKKISSFNEHTFNQIKSNYPKSLLLFNDRDSYYSKNSLKNIFATDLRIEFENENKKSNFKTYSYKKFICDIAIMESLRNSSSIFKQNYNLYSKMYKLNKFDSLKLARYTDDPELIKLEKKYREEIYGVDEINTTETEDIITTPKSNKKVETKNKSISKELQRVMENVSFFDEEDKLILLNICYHNIAAIPISEFAKINYITNGLFNEDFLLNKNTGNSTFYKKLNNGPAYFPPSVSQEKISLLIYKIEKLKEFNLLSLLKLLRSIRIRL